MSAASDFHYASSFGRPGNFFAPVGDVAPSRKVSGRPPVEARQLDASLRDLLLHRRSHRQFTGEDLSSAELKAILWAGLGSSSSEKEEEHHTYPSAGGLFPTRCYVAVNRCDALDRGIYRYDAQAHRLKLRSTIDLPDDMQRWFLTRHINFAQVGATIFLVSSLLPVMTRYGERGYRYALLEAGHIGQNICLAATAMSIAHTPLGGFDDDSVNLALRLAPGRAVVYSIVLGSKAADGAAS